MIFMAKESKLALGTAQFGFDYGISNKTGQIKAEKALEILGKAVENGITVVDTAFAYGESEAVIGKFSGKNSLKVVSKASKCSAEELPVFFRKSLEKLGLEKIYAYLLHDFDSFQKNPGLWDAMKELKKQGLVEKIGFSLYHPKHAEELFHQGFEFDLVQIPFSVFDQRFLELLPALKKRNVEVHARSVFLQGLVFKKPEELEGQFAGIKEKVSGLIAISEEIGVSIASVCINFVALDENIDKVVLGVDSLSNLEENIKALSHQNKVKFVLPKLLGLKEDNEKILLPFKWKK